MDNLTWLTDWFAKRCDGEWESDFGVSIESVNNPGWMVRIDLDGTGVDPSSFAAMAEQRSPSNWVECKVEAGAWMGGAGVGNLDEVIGIFRAWVEGTRKPASRPVGRGGPPPAPQRGPAARPGKPWQRPGGPRR